MHSTDVSGNANFLTRLTRFSEWQRLKRSIAWIFRLKPKQSITDDAANRVERATNVKAEPLRIEELDRAEKTILKLVQGGAFPKEIETLQKIQRPDSKNDRQLAKAKKSEIKK